MKYASFEMAKHIVADWSTELAQKLGRSPETIVANGLLLPEDFSPDETIRIVMGDGSYAVFKYAFFVINKRRRALAVFTEHSGYHVFSTNELSIFSIHEKLLYSEHASEAL